MIILNNLEASTVRGGSEHPWDSDRTEIQIEDVDLEHPWGSDRNESGIIN